MSNYLKLVSINIEWDKHINRVLSFIKRTNPDVVCLQEVFESDFKMMKKTFGMDGVFAPMTKIKLTQGNRKMITLVGVAILSKLPIERSGQSYYYGNPDSIPEFIFGDMTRQWRVLPHVVIKKRKKQLTIGTTHFTWTPDGKPDQNQKRDIKKFLQLLKNFSALIFCGDFNAPRGGEIFSIIADRYIDHIPKKYATSIDRKLHRDGPLPVMVDGLFSSPEYKVKNVRLASGVSDHCAIVAEVQ